MAAAQSLHLVERGARDAEPLLFVHGWGLSSGAFGAFFERLAGSYRVIAPDLPGFGRSPAGGRAVSYEEYAEALADLLTGLGIARCHVVGLSMGGGVALTLAARHPERVRALVLMAPTGCPEGSLPQLARCRVREFAEQVRARAPLGDKAQVLRSFAANLLLHPASLYAAVRMLASRRIVEEAGRVGAPTLLLWGARDRTIPPHLAAEFVARLPHATLRVVPDAFHEMPTSRPEETAAIIHDFISRAGA